MKQKMEPGIIEMGGPMALSDRRSFSARKSSEIEKSLRKLLEEKTFVQKSRTNKAFFGLQPHEETSRELLSLDSELQLKSLPLVVSADSTKDVQVVAAKSPCNCGCGKKSKKKARKSLTVEAGQTKVFDKCARFDKVVNFGQLKFVEGAILSTIELNNYGEVVSDFDLEIHAERLISESGSFSSPRKIVLHSDNDLVVRGGDFHAPSISFDCKKTLDVSAHGLDGKVSVKAAMVSVGTKSGELNIAEHICYGDPVYWNEGTGEMTIGDISSSGEDVVIWSNGPNINIKNIDTTGGSGPGRVTIVTNAGATKPGDDSPYPCTDCSSYIPSGGGGGTVNGMNYFNVTAKGSIEIRGNIQTPEDSVRLISGDKVRVDGDIKTSKPGFRNGAVEIRCYKDASTSTEFVIGGSGNANGVNGSIDASTSGSGYGGVTFIFVKNHAAGGIKLEDPSALSVQADTGKTGIIALDASDGPVTFGAGTLSADGTSGQPAGRIYVVSDSVVATDGLTILTASDGGGAIVNNANQVNISASIVSYGASGLTVKAHGGSSRNGGAGITSKGAYSLSTIWNPPNPHTLVTSSIIDWINHDLSFNGSGTFKLEANSFNIGRRSVGVTGRNVTFNGGAVEIESSGKEKDDFYCSAGVSARNHLKFAGGAASIKSNGYQGSDGCEVIVFSHTFERTSDSTLVLQADGDGKGNGGFVSFEANEEGTIPITFGRTAGTLSVSANSGSSDGNGGRIEIYSGNFYDYENPDAAGAPIVIKDSTNPQNPVLSVNPKGTDGDAGYIAIHCAANITFTESNSEIRADGKGNGRGGTIILRALMTGSALSIADNILSAKGGSTGDGGTIKLASNTNLTMKAAKLLVTVGQDARSNGRGGRIEGTSEAGHIIVEGTLNTDGKGKGKGGTIRLDANQELQYGTNEFSAKGGNKGDGGTIYLKSGDDFTIAGSKTLVDPGQDDDSNGEGGTIQISSGADLTITGTMIADGKGKGKGGSILLRAEEKLTRSNTVLHADGGCLGHGGIVTSSGDSIEHANGIATAKAGDGNCSLFRSFVNTQGTRGGDYTLEVRGFGPATLELTDDIDVTGDGEDGAGGSVLITTPGAFSFGEHTIKADGTNGDGGTVIIACKSNLTVNATQISANAGAGRTGGTINVKAENSTLSLQGTFDVSGKTKSQNSGNGGNLIFTGDQIDIGQATFKADGGTAGNGGEGGNIVFDITSTNFIELKNRLESAPKISATGGGSKKGGSVKLKFANNKNGSDEFINVNRIIRVDGGPKAAVGTPWGRITINTVECQQWRAGNSWPRSFWTTESPETFPSPTSPEVRAWTASQKLSGGARTQLSSPPISARLYVMENVDKWAKFFYGMSATNYAKAFGQPKIKNALGVTLVAPTHDTTIFNRNKTIVNKGIEWTAFHEFGHTLSNQNGWQMPLTFKIFEDIEPGYGINRLPCDQVFLSSTCVSLSKIPAHPNRNWLILGGIVFDYIGQQVQVKTPDGKVHTDIVPDVGELVPELFAAIQNQLAKTNYQHSVEKVESGIGEIRKAYSKFNSTNKMLRKLVL